MLACQLTQTLTSLHKIQYELTLEIEAEPPMPCHGLLSYKPARLVQSQASTCPTFGVHSSRRCKSDPPRALDFGKRWPAFLGRARRRRGCCGWIKYMSYDTRF